ncbi:heme o synthase [Methylobacterium frigidaeris]|uniref:Protoheme IX farnesyltransferase n=1 Tax=Methylobacterium frigidaeris TaxID=2038277 RepID=A0AA37H9Q3_9HYPH|nr:heme o synthase [Methylobacterium frigidaeris]PIK70805.1 protoheme IX farnesyltransferase [Methylobacterium frigidaeris]GJD61921.1 Protoheme IX farnesyltransferase [Methylobacterium frigidaeris]
MTSLTNSAISDRPFAEASSSGGEVADYFALLKPRVMALVIFTALVGMTVTPSHVNPVIGAISLLMIAVGAGASGCLNMWWDADVDAVMTRTRTRPIPAGRIQPGEALSFGLTLSVGSVLVLGLAANWLSAGLLAFTIVFYAVIYSMWLKRSTAQNIVIGGAAGALPPMIGQAVVTGSIGIEGTVLFLIIFIWTPPHFWALALVKAGEYARAGIPMMPNTAGPDSTRRQILAYSVVLAPLGLAPVFLGFGGLIYGLVGLLGGLAMVALSVQVLRRREGEAANKAAMSLFGFSILYLFLLFSALLAEQGLGLFRPVFG